MKKLIFLSTLVVFVFFLATISGCKKNDTNTQTVTYVLTDYQGQTGYYNYQYTDTFIDTITAAGIQQAFITQGITYNVSKVTTAKLSSLSVSVVNGGNLNYVSSVQVYINAAGAPGLGTEMAYSTSIPANTTVLSLTMTNNELKSYLATNNVVTLLVKNAGSDNGAYLDFSNGVILAQVQQ